MQKEIDEILLQVGRPGRYTGNEVNCIVKDPQSVEVRFALAFPDVYEIGMSHLGYEILYHILNKNSWIAAERVYTPWVDMQQQMRTNGIPLFTLENRSAVREFDIVGFTLQYELQYTNLLAMLDLAAIPLEAKDRNEDDPFILAGGPCAFNPEPLARFLDCVVIGDSETAIVEISEVVRTGKKNGKKRNEILQDFAAIAGVYVPSLYHVVDGRVVPFDKSVKAVIKARIEDELREGFYPESPLVPLIEITHDRFSLEVMRGCNRGCRFCNAGMIYRPERYRSVDNLVKHCRTVISNTGFEEISLVSLSTSDYPQLPELLTRLKDWAMSKGVSISFPSLRAETFTPEIAALSRGFRKSGLTLAPEAGTQRLRDVINKNNTEEDLLRSIKTAFEFGWKRVKLYFMIGLPTETEEDIKGIADLVNKAAEIGRKMGKREISVSISPFSPKPHTPFQWEAQDSTDDFKKKQSILQQTVSRKQIKLNWRDPSVSKLEAVMGRGDRLLGEVILTAYRAGACFDSWTEHFNFERWENAFATHDLSMDSYTKAISVDAVLPWDHLEKGITREFLLKERDNAFSEKTTPDCAIDGCSNCGLIQQKACKNIHLKTKSAEPSVQINDDQQWGRNKKRILQPVVSRKLRVHYEKGKGVRLASHLDTVRIFLRAFRRANISLALSQGYRPHPKIAPGPPLSLGFTSKAEYLDVEIVSPLPENFIEIFNQKLPRGLNIIDYVWIQGKTASLNSIISLTGYQVELPEEVNLEEMEAAITAFMGKNKINVQRFKKGKFVTVDIRSYVVRMSLEAYYLDVLLSTGPGGTARMSEVMAELLPDVKNPILGMHVMRTAQLIDQHGKTRTPLDL